MSVSLAGPCLPPSSSLQPIRNIVTSSEESITTALRNLQTLYCPLRLPTAISNPIVRRKHIPAASTPIPVDSGYASHDEDEDDDALLKEVTATIRTDPFERAFATKWLTTLIGRAEEMDLDESVRERIVDDAAFILTSFSDLSNENEETALARAFSFPTSSGHSINITLNDEPLTGTDHTDVGLQSWGASIVLSSMLCAKPERFGLVHLPETATLIELGAGTGLVSLTLAKLLPGLGIANANITATDYHSAVLQNCRVNIKTNFPSASYPTPPVDTAILDWSQSPACLRSTSDLLVASDVVYAPEHAAWLRDCAADLLAPRGTFWLMVTVRKTGKFEGISDTVEAAFVSEQCPRDQGGRMFKILETEFVEKRRGIGRGDESGYKLYKIGWA